MIVETYIFMLCSKSHFDYWIGVNLLQITGFGQFELSPEIVSLCQRVHLGVSFENMKEIYKCIVRYVELEKRQLTSPRYIIGLHIPKKTSENSLKTFLTRNLHINSECYQCLCLVFTSRGFFQWWYKKLWNCYCIGHLKASLNNQKWP